MSFGVDSIRIPDPGLKQDQAFMTLKTVEFRSIPSLQQPYCLDFKLGFEIK